MKMKLVTPSNCAMIQVAFDSGELALDLVYGLITEGENLSVHVEKELKVHMLMLDLIISWAF